MNILVTGGAGFIGTNLIKKLSLDGHIITSIDNYSTGLKSNHLQNVNYIDCDIREIKNYDKFGNFDFVFHLAAIARIQPSFEIPIKYFETNANGTLTLSYFCSKNKIPIVYAGSSSHHSGKYKNPYTFSKDVGEEIIKLFENIYGLKSTIARFYNVYGPNQLLEGNYTTLIGRWMYNIVNNLPCVIYGDGEQRRDFTHVDDIVNALILIMEKECYGHIFELGRGKNYSVNEIAKLFKISPEYSEPKLGEARETLCDSTEAKNLLGWEPNINVEDYINYFLTNK